jgi:hypothetical protein
MHGSGRDCLAILLQNRTLYYSERIQMIIPLAKDLWLIRYKMSKLGADLRRNVTVIRLNSGKLVIHSTGPFTAADIAAISGLGTPTWLVDSMLAHDTFAKVGREAFPNIAYFAPPGFMPGIPTESLKTVPGEWGSELRVLEISGMPSFQEYAFFHAPSRTLIVADLVFNFGPGESGLTKFLLKLAVLGDHHPGVSRPFKMAVKDKQAFARSKAAILEWDFNRVIVGHGEVIESGGKKKVAAALAEAGI